MFSHPRYLLFVAHLFAVCSLAAQSNWSVRYQDLPIKSRLPETYSTKSSAAESIHTTYTNVLSIGYLDAQFDTLLHDSTYEVVVHSGKKYFIKSIQWLQDTSSVPLLTDTWRKAKPMDVVLLENRAEEILTRYENRGHPFASVLLTDARMQDDKIDVTYRLDQGPLVLMDSVILKSESKTPGRYVRNYLDFRKGDLYDEEKMKTLERKIKEIPFLRMRQSPEVRFKQGKADLYLFVEKKKANFFNGILGVRPDDVTGKINITGDVEIKLLNAFNSGEELYLNWRKMQAQTQDLTSKLFLPYLFNTPIGIDGQLKIYKRDSTFTSIKSSAGLVFNFGGLNRLKVFAEKNTTNQLSTFVTAQSLANVNSTFYGLSLQLEQLDYRYNPQKGYSILAEGATGVRNVSSPNQVSDITTDTPIKRNVHRIDIQFDYYIATFKRQCIKIGGHGVGLFAPSIFDNEMFRLGGLRTLRGIDEESINATSYSVGTLEYRFLFEENSAFYVFADQGWYEKKSAKTFLTDTPIGFGAGVNFETKAGIFTFNYAIGQQFDNPILVRNAKVSFGFRNIF